MWKEERDQDNGKSKQVKELPKENHNEMEKMKHPRASPQEDGKFIDPKEKEKEGSNDTRATGQEETAKTSGDFPAIAQGEDNVMIDGMSVMTGVT
eukprot:3715570-Ditylum_brightwellii.AAC.1